MFLGVSTTEATSAQEHAKSVKADSCELLPTTTGILIIYAFGEKASSVLFILTGALQSNIIGD